MFDVIEWIFVFEILFNVAFNTIKNRVREYEFLYSLYTIGIDAYGQMCLKKNEESLS